MLRTKCPAFPTHRARITHRLCADDADADAGLRTVILAVRLSAVDKQMTAVRAEIRVLCELGITRWACSVHRSVGSIAKTLPTKDTKREFMNIFLRELRGTIFSLSYPVFSAIDFACKNSSK